MSRYLAVIWNAQYPHHGAQETLARVREMLPEMKLVMHAEGLRLFCVADPAEPFNVYAGGAHSQVAVLGQLFPRDFNEDEAPPPFVLDERSESAIVASCGRALTERYWGRYLAFIHDSSLQTTRIIRDPLGGIACYMRFDAGVSVAFSDIDDYCTLVPEQASFSINWRYISAWLMHPSLQSAETGLKDIYAVRPGECLQLDHAVEAGRSLYWNIAKIALTDPIEDMAAAAALARRTIRACVGAWASVHPRIVLRLSGGLDSSVLLACLARAPSLPEVACVNYFTRSGAGDERRFARLAVESTGALSGRHFKLLEFERDPADMQIHELFDAKRSPCPLRCLTMLFERRLDMRLQQAYGTVLFAGFGGDGIFHRRTDEEPAVDYVYRHGLGWELPRVIYGAARGRGTIWSVFSHTIERGLLHRRERYQSPFLIKEAGLVNPAVREKAMQDQDGYLVPLWRAGAAVTDLRRLSPGKLRHIDLMSISWYLRDAFQQREHLRWEAPLASQPVIELFARIPLYVLTKGGIDRAVARRAFAQDLSADLLARRSKCLVNRVQHQALRRHWPFIREFMLEGILVKERLLDRRCVEELLSRPDTERAPEMAALMFFHFDTELWLRRWQRPGEFRRAEQTRFG